MTMILDNNGAHLLKALLSTKSNEWHRLNTERLIQWTFWEIDDIITWKLKTKESELYDEISKICNILLSRAYAIDTFFAPYSRIPLEERNSSTIFPPLIWFFDTHEGKDNPVLLSSAYASGLGAKNLQEVLQSFSDKNFLHKYYTLKSVKKAQDALNQKVREWSWWYNKPLELLTKDWRLLEWMSSGYEIWWNKYQIRTGVDITWWKINEDVDFSDISNLWIKLDTWFVIDEYRNKVLQLVEENEVSLLFDILDYFRFIAKWLDYLWNESHLLLNLRYNNSIALTLPWENPNLWEMTNDLPIIFNWWYQIGYWYDIIWIKKMIENIKNGDFNRFAFWENFEITKWLMHSEESYVWPFSINTPDWEKRTFPWIRDIRWEDSLWIATNFQPTDGITMVHHELSD